MKRLFHFFVFMVFYSISAAATTIDVSRDSLIRLAQTTQDPGTKIQAYRNLADIFSEEPEEQYYLKLLYQAAKKANDKEAVLDALSDLAYTHIVDKSADSVYYYIDLIQKEADKQAVSNILPQIRMKLLDKRLELGEKEEKAALDYELNCLKSADKSNIYIRIENAYVIGSSLFCKKKYEEAKVHLEQAYQLAKTLTGKNDFKYRITTAWLYAHNFNNKESRNQCVKLLEDVLDSYKRHFEQNLAKQRPFYPIYQHYLHCYASILIQAEVLPEEKTLYYMSEIKKLTPRISKPFDKYNCFLAMNNYYLSIEDYPNALKTNDSLMVYGRILIPMREYSRHYLKSQIYEQMGNYQKALESHKRYAYLKDSVASQQSEKQLNTLQVEYEVDKLEYEKTTLENKNKKFQIIALSIILILAISGCLYFYWHWKKEKAMKLSLHKLNQKAEESEKMKTEFINSMCHEIRTPLNAIVGFSDIIVDESFDNESKKEFFELVKSNTVLLTSLIEHLLVVSNLDSSHEMLPCQITNINDICREEFSKAAGKNKKGLEYKLELPEEDIIILTNTKYIALVIENLLSNAFKFTQEGKVVLGLRKDEAGQRVLIDVTDTGCGVPPEKQEVIFERFTKLDQFTQGNGLGLFLSKLIIDRLAGSIYCDSSYTNGARFIISLSTSTDI